MKSHLHDSAALFPVKEAPLPIQLKTGWAPNPVWTIWTTEKSTALTGNRMIPRLTSLWPSHYTDYTATSELVSHKMYASPNSCDVFVLLLAGDFQLATDNFGKRKFIRYAYTNRVIRSGDWCNGQNQGFKCRKRVAPSTISFISAYHLYSACKALQYTTITFVPTWIDILVSNRTFCSSPALHSPSAFRLCDYNIPIQSVFMTPVGIAYSVHRFATDWTVRESNPGGARFSARV